ncbi:uncharacterized protein LOC123538565 [Mercenaria mercenaria]|uniref:uncharacterized protein LOC123538565 n=1 Tax=Mercenaria mercenaria TaxID=6596 RepID=UPI00234EFBDE|nr:uncharacterized protein LOC123538565 [Mercenaria mercenaria]
MDLSRLLAFVVLIFVHGVYCDTECDCNTNKELMELIHKDYLQMRLENFKIMSRLRRLEITKQTVSAKSDPLTAKGSRQKVADGIDAKYAKITAQLERVNDIDAKYANITAQLERVDEIDAKYAKLNAQPERINKLEANIAHLTEQSENKTRTIEDKLAKTVENLERIDEIEDKIVKIGEMMNRNEANITTQMEWMDKVDAKLTTIASQIIGILEKMDDYKMAFDFRNIVTKTILAEKTSRNKFDSNIRNQIENIKHLFTEFKTETATLVHDQRVSLSTKHETFTEQMTRQVAEVYHQMYTDIGDITSELNKVTEKVSKMNTEISTLNEITTEDKTDGAWSSWGNWGSCSVTCGGGIRSQTRTCTNPKPSLLGKICDGAPVQLSICNKQTCPDHKIAFTAYGTTGTSPVVLITLL